MVFCGMLHSLNKIEESNSEESNSAIINLDTYQLIKQSTSTTIENSQYNNYKYVTITGLNTPDDTGFYNDITMPENIDFNVAIIHIEKEYSYTSWPGYYIESNYYINLDIGNILMSDQHRMTLLDVPRNATIEGPLANLPKYWSLGEDILLILRLYNNTLRADLIQSKTPNDISNINLNNNNNIQISGGGHFATYNYNYNKSSLNDIEIRFRNRSDSNHLSYNTRKFNISLQNI